MVPSSYNAFFAAVATGAAALIGLLFVAVSVRDETIFGARSVAGGRALAITAFTGLVDTLLVSLLALIPQDNLGYGAAILGVISIWSVIQLHRGLHWARSTILLSLAVLAYLVQLGYGIVLLIHPHDASSVNNISYVLFAVVVVSLQRAWSLLEGKHLEAAKAESGDGQGSHPLL
jgi:heme/copper-type cytochrome/quinol oxidase subunit 4